MAQRRQLKASELNGIEIYQDSKGTIFWDFLTRKGYFLTSKDTRAYMLYVAVTPLAMAFGAILFMAFNVPAKVAIIAGVVVFVALSLVYRFFYVYRLPEAKGFKKPNRGSIVKNLAEKYSTKRLWLLVVMLIATAILMFIYTTMVEMTKFNLYATYGLAGVAIVFALLILIAITKQNKK